MGAQAPLRVLEFYSGIGGLRYSLESSGVSAGVVCAFDINEVANDVYEHNFGHRPSQSACLVAAQGNVQRLSVQELDKYDSDVWLMSPPCQPYTRQGLKKDSSDGRATSFLSLLEKLQKMQKPPRYLFVENVVGFEVSDTHARLMCALEQADFRAQEFVLSPIDFGIPYSRPRYFCLAKHRTVAECSPSLVDCYNQGIAVPLCYSGDSISEGAEEEELAVKCRSRVTEHVEADHSVRQDAGSLAGLCDCWPPRAPRLLGEFLELEPDACGELEEPQDLVFVEGTASTSDVTQASICRPLQALDVVSSTSAAHLDPPGRPGDMHSSSAAPGSESSSNTAQLAEGVNKSGNSWKQYKVSPSILQRWGEVLGSQSCTCVPDNSDSQSCTCVPDITTDQSLRCCCFTKSYVKYAKGTGSVLATKVDGLYMHPTTGSEDVTMWRGVPLNKLGIRYFTPREDHEPFRAPHVQVANLHSFPQSFSFPCHVTLKQRYAMLGNSLNVSVVAALLKHLLMSPSIKKGSLCSFTKRSK
eukprot:SM000309S11867  [mRNA]  locus=s309:93328:97164:+ [translate_table: standard]